MQTKPTFSYAYFYNAYDFTSGKVERKISRYVRARAKNPQLRAIEAQLRADPSESYYHILSSDQPDRPVAEGKVMI